MCTKLFVVMFCCLITNSIQDSFKLQRVIVLSRHNVRTPLANDLTDISPKTWPQWSQKSGYLTPKGAYLEGLMGRFFSKWLINKGLLPVSCPEQDDVFVYANTKQRTRASANAFVSKAFPGCNITVHVNNKTDPIFNPVIHNTTDIFKQLALTQMENILQSLKLNNSYELIEQILDYKDSKLCTNSFKCELITDTNEINGIVAGRKPFIVGPLKISKGAADAFIMEYYNGLNSSSVAWGNLNKSNKWKTIMQLSKGYHDVIFNTTIVARDMASPLIKYMKDIFVNKQTKFSLLIGHDANIFTVLTGMRFKSYVLPKQYEMSPVGGKIVFQKWLDDATGRYLLRINFIYASTRQLRKGLTLDLANPPMVQILELENCTVDKNGFCLWDDFLKALDDY